MSRPQKQTVDYFPHVTKPGKTIFILERKFGNDGYTFWFKLLEILGATDGHSYNISETNEREYLWAYCNVTEEKGLEILQACADMDAIDKKLHKKDIIWSDNFVANLTHLYSKRTSELPIKPVSGEKTMVSGDGNPHSIVKYSKVEDSKEKKRPFVAGDKITFDRSTRKFDGITPDYLSYLKGQYPAVDVDGKLREMETWLDANPKNQKSNYKRFITNWLKREQDKAPRADKQEPGTSSVWDKYKENK